MKQRMIERRFNRCLLRPADLPPSQPDVRVVGVFNPAAAATPEGVTLLIRVAETAREKRPGWVALPRWDLEAGRITMDWLREEEVDFLDPRMVIVKATGLRRLTFISHLTVATSRDGRALDTASSARFFPADENEEFGVEDPRLTPLDGRFYFTYVAVSPHGAATALASTTDFRRFTRHGIIFPPENKDVVLFPERIGGRFVALHRPNPHQHFAAPEMWLATSPDLRHWGEHQPFLGSGGEWDVGRVGAGAPPLRTEAGWLEIYHGNDRRPGKPGVGAYSAGLLLLDAADPARILAVRGRAMTPETDYERHGFVPNVVFPTAAVPRGENLLVYYGAADEACGVLEWRLADVLAALRPE